MYTGEKRQRGEHTSLLIFVNTTYNKEKGHLKIFFIDNFKNKAYNNRYVNVTRWL